MRYPAGRFLAILLIFVFIACRKDNSPGSGAFSYDTYYAVKPDIQNCLAGILKESSKQAALNQVNYIRSLHQLPPVSYNTADDAAVQQSALISAANNSLSHNPGADEECYSAEGAAACGKSNLGLLSSSGIKNITDEENIDLWLTDKFSDGIGHRRWLLNPFLKYITYGRVDGKPKRSDYSFVSAASLKVINNEYADIRDLKIDFVAYPYNNYPSALFPKNLFMSFSVLIDKTDPLNNVDVDFKKATIEITSVTGGQLTVSSISYDNLYTGIPNSLQWLAAGLQDNVSYMVTIKNVWVKGFIKNYQYNFKLTK